MKSLLLSVGAVLALAYNPMPPAAAQRAAVELARAAAFSGQESVAFNEAVFRARTGCVTYAFAASAYQLVGLDDPRLFLRPRTTARRNALRWLEFLGFPARAHVRLNGRDGAAGLRCQTPLTQPGENGRDNAHSRSG
jgi:hypothetical protein